MVEHGARWRTYAQSERNRAAMNHPEGHHQWDGEMGCWHQGCKHALAEPHHVLCMHCKSMAQETPQYLKRFARAIQCIQTALRWKPPARRKARLPTPTTQRQCATQQLLTDALAAIRTRQAGKTEQDKYWEGLERLLAGQIPTSVAVTEAPEWAHKN